MSQRLKTFGAGLVVCFLVAAFLFAIVVLSTANDDDNSTSLLLAIDRSASFVGDDQSIVDLAAGDQVPDGTLVRAAACRNALDWSADVALTPDLVVTSDEVHVRVAEMLSRGEVSPELALKVESVFWATEAVPRIQEVVAAGFDESEVASYLSERAMAPSQFARDSFVVYISSATMTNQTVQYVDVRAFEPTSMNLRSGRLSELNPIVAGVGEFSFSFEQCEEFIR